jgi:hypothetical protein
MEPFKMRHRSSLHRKITVESRIQIRRFSLMAAILLIHAVVFVGVFAQRPELSLADRIVSFPCSEIRRGSGTPLWPVSGRWTMNFCGAQRVLM